MKQAVEWDGKPQSSTVVPILKVKLRLVHMLANLLFACLQRLCYIDKGISGFAIDWINQDILWANRQKSTIEATDMNGKKRRVILRNVGRPTKITIDAEQR